MQRDHPPTETLVCHYASSTHNNHEAHTLSSCHDEGWDKIYHQHNLEELPWELGRPREILIELTGSGQIRPEKALDICCGAGSDPIYLTKQGFSVTRLDISDQAVIHARKKARESYAEMGLLVGSVPSLPFKQAEFDLIFDFGCFHHVSVEKRTPFITGVHRVLKPNGTYVLTCARTPPEHTQDYCRTSGELSNLKTE